MIRELVFVFTLHRGPQEHPGGDRWFSADKAKHFFLASFVQSAAFGTLNASGLDRRTSFIGASAVSIGVSLGKEIADRRRGGRFSARDLVWDAAGIAAASVILRRTK
jgi:uncharacterized protein YfiM (DUF2279 family)